MNQESALVKTKMLELLSCAFQMKQRWLDGLVWSSLVLSIIVGYLNPNPVYTNLLNTYLICKHIL